MVADRAKKSKLTEEGEQEQCDHIHTDFVLSVEKLQEVQDELEKINEEASDKVLEVEQKFNEIRRPVYDKRSDIIKCIPEFWLTAFLSHPALCDLLTEDDQKIFKYLDSLDVEDFKDVKSGYSITFNFKENPYFDQKKLTKTFMFFDEGTSKITGTNIEWKENADAANGADHDKKGNKRPLAAVSFFSWFSESETEQKDISEFHDDVAEIIKEDLWPNPLKYFNNEADEEDSEGDGDGDEDEKENGDDDDDDDEPEDDGEDGNEEDN